MTEMKLDERQQKVNELMEQLSTGKPLTREEKMSGGWDGTNEDITNIVAYFTEEIMMAYGVKKRMARRLFCEAITRSLVSEEIMNMIDYIMED